MTLEQDQSEPTNKSAELALPYEGVTDKVFVDLLTDRVSFVRSSMQHVREQNPPLLDILVHLIVKSDRETILDWCLCYYEIYRRSAEHAGLPMITISQSLVDSIWAQEDKQIQLSEQGDDQTIGDFFKRKEELQDERVNIECKKSKELEKFWAYLINFKAYSISHQKLPLFLINESFDIMYDIQEVFLEQEKVNKLNQSFPK